MIINNNQQYQTVQRPKNGQSKPPSFKGAQTGAAVLNYLATNESMGATVVDFLSMVIPRTIVDYTRNTETGNETARREIFSGLLYPVAGFIGMGAALAISPFIKNKYDVPFHKLTANSDSIESMSHAFKNSLEQNKGVDPKKNKEKVLHNFLEQLVDGASAQSTDKTSRISDKPELRNEIIADLKKSIMDPKGGYSIPKEQQAPLHRKLLKAMGTSQNVKLSIKGKKEDIITDGDNFLKNTYEMGKAFMEDKVITEFSEKSVADNKFVKSLKGFVGKKMAIGLSAACLTGFLTQEVNRQITKRKTGSDAFVGSISDDPNAPPPKKDKSFGFQMLKLASAAGMAVLAAKTIGGKVKDIPKKLQFSGLVPTIPQYAVLYSATITGRMFSASDKNELRETTVRDYIGFASWLVLGNLAAKGVAKYFENKNKDVKMFNVDKKEQSKLNKFQKLMKLQLRTQEEVLYADKATNIKDGFKKSLKKLGKNSATRKTIKYLNIAQLSGYAYSSVLLGILLPLYNKKMTEMRSSKQRKQNALSQPVANQNVNQPGYNGAKFLKDKSKTFGASSSAFNKFTA